MIKIPYKDFELQSSELWGSKIDLNAQFQIQLMGFEIKSVPFFRFVFFRFFLNSSYHEITINQEIKMVIIGKKEL